MSQAAEQRDRVTPKAIAIACLFCGAPVVGGKRITAGPSANICDWCVENCVEILREERDAAARRKAAGEREYQSWFAAS